MSRWIHVKVRKVIRVDNTDLNVEFWGQFFPGTYGTYYQPPDVSEFDVQEMYIVVDNKTTDVAVEISDDMFESIYDDLIMLCHDATDYMSDTL